MPKNRKAKIKKDEFYTPKEVAEMLETAPTKDSRKQLVLRKIRNGDLKYKNVGDENQPRYLVRGKDLLDYYNTQMKPGQYIKK